MRYLHGKLMPGKARAVEAAARIFFTHHAALFGLDPTGEALHVVAVEHDARGAAGVRLEQRIGGIRVWGSDIRAQMDPEGMLHTIHGRLVPLVRPPRLVPEVSPERAEAIARQAVTIPSELEQAPELVIARLGDQDQLAWHIRLHTTEPARWQLLVDAQDGRIVDRQNIVASAKQRLTYSAENTTWLPGVLVRREGQAPTGDAHADAAHDNAGRVYDYFFQMYGRDSLDGRGMAIESTVHYGQAYANAFWNGSEVVYGDGDGEQFGPLGFGLDVAAHELTHGIIERTARLAWQQQPGALNEAYADIFAVLVDTANWEIGESVYTPRIAGDALRSLADPGRYGQPRSWAEYLELPLTSEGDNGGIHVNSSIISHVAYKIATTIGRQKLGQIFYRTLTMKLTTVSDFLDARDLTIQACGELVGMHGISSADCRVVQSAFAEAGLGAQPDAPGNLSRRVYLPLIPNRATECGVDSVQNGDFEAGVRGWPNLGAVLQPWPDQQGFNWSTRLDSVDQMLQVVSLPAGTQRAMLRLDLRGNAGEAGGQARIRLEDAETHAPVGTNATAATSEDGSWQPFAALLQNLGDHPALRLVIEHVQGTPPLYLDNVRLVGECAVP